MSGRVKIGLAGVAVVAIIAFPLGAHYRAKWRLRDYRLKLRASGEQLTIEELAPKVSFEEIKAGGELVLAASRLISSYSNPPMMKIVAPGRALVASREPVLPTPDSANLWPGLELLVAANEDALAQLRAAVTGPETRFAFELDYRAGPKVLLAHLPRLKSVAQWLSLAAMVDLHNGRLPNACENLQAFTVTVAYSRKDALLLSELVRIAMAAICVSTTWEALQAPGWRDDSLERLQNLWQSVDFVSQAASALAMEGAFLEGNFTAGRESYTGVGLFGGGSSGSGLAELAQMGKDVLDDPGEGIKSVLHRYPAYWGWKYWQSYKDELASAEAIQAALEQLRRAKTGCPFGVVMADFETRLAAVRNRYPSAGAFIGYAPGESLDKFFLRIRNVEMERVLLVCAIALKRYELRHGSYPARLDGLFPEFITETPRDPIDGKPLRYRLNPDGTFLLYSIGENGVDDGGNPKMSPDAPWQWWRGRDAVWPLPATAEQVQAEFRQAASEFERQVAARNAIPKSVLDQFRRRYGLAPVTSPQTNSANGK
jgi:hypothetical protein